MDNQDISLLLQRTAELERALAAKNRELEIEAALENVRSRSLAMQQSEELKDVVQVVFDNLQHLGFVFDDGAVSILLFKEGSRDHLQWTADPRQAYAVPLDVRYTDHSIPASLMEAKESGVNFFAKLFPVEEKNAYFNYLFAHSNYRDMPEAVKQLILGSEHYGYSVAFARQSAILIPTNSGRLVTGEQKETLIRFAKVFEQAYIRFLDLQKAEAQAREAQVEAALERVRSRTMAMQRSGELSAVATVLFQQVKALGVPQWTCGFCIWDIGDTECMWYPGSPDGEILPPGRFPLTEHPVFKLMDESRKRGDELYVFEKEGELQADHYRYLMTLPGIRELLQDMLDSGLTIPTFQIDHYANFAYGNLIFITYEHFPEMHDIFKRFAKVFEQTYTRFLDLQKAEAQAREAQIEAALERVRARTMAMQKGGELTEVAELLFKQVNNLGIQTCTTGFNVWSDDNNSWVDYVTNPQGGFLEPYTVAATQFPVFVEVSDARKRGDEFYVQSVAGELLKETYEHLSRFGEKQFKAILDSGFQFPSKQIHHFVFGSKVSLMFITYEPVPEAHDLFKRFGKVFEQTFTRFLDLQKAEASAREAEIEAGLERVRAAANAMHKSTELLNVISALSEQFQQLGFTIDSANFNTSYREKDWNLWLYNPGFPMYSDKVHIPYFDHPYFNRTIEALKNGSDFTAFVFNQEEKDCFLDYIYQNTIAKHTSEERKKYTYSKPGFAWSAVYLKNTAVTIANYDAAPYTEEQNAILRRFGSVFEQSYTRFLDLQKAEAQAREADIQLALERVRARSLAMHQTAELQEVVSMVAQQLMQMSVAIDGGVCIVVNEEVQNNMPLWASAGAADYAQKITVPFLARPIFTRMREAIINREALLTEHYTKAEKDEFFRHLFGHHPWDRLPNERKEELLAREGGYCRSLAASHYTTIVMINHKGNAFSEADNAILKRFGGVLEQSYTRFLDLQKAESQAREATVEAALERVRGKAMAMHNSHDLSATASMVFTELRTLGINPIRCGVGLLNKESRKAQLYSATSSATGDSLSLVGWVQLEGHPVLEKIYDAWLHNEDYFPVLSGEQLKSYYELLLAGLAVSLPDWQSGQKQYGHFFPFSIGCLYAWSAVAYNEAEIKTLKRFASIIDLTFRRYMDLQKAEASAKEAIKQAALDRVRADIASMRTVGDLDRITPLIWNELTTLGIPFTRCGVFIMDEAQQLIHTFLSTPEGKAIAAFHLPYFTPGNIAQVLAHWKAKKIYTDHWDELTFTEFAHTIVNQGALASAEHYLKTIPRGGFYLHFLPFLQGMLYVGNTALLGEEEMNLLQSIAEAFSTAYARYEDFNKLEMAKRQVDKTLAELKQTQQQLIQAEKMASLGELTAGVAHEIQNPLNFVNNFSETNTELIDELEVAIDKHDITGVKAIARDIRENEQKIAHHGRRADAIVKGMLQHSRQSSGKKEPVDINALCDEYLRLSYHGFRAKDKDFSVKLLTSYDPAVGKVAVVPQDIGRVLLNLFNNAFYAVQQRKGQLNGNYEPEVSVSTKRDSDHLLITVQDDGIGMPEHVVNKVFQPFFTTKPTGEGTGLGLSLSYDIVTKGHDGTLSVQSKEGEGAAFVVMLPAN